MSREVCRYLLVAALLIVLAVISQSDECHSQGQDTCESVLVNLDQKTNRLSEYISALQNAHLERDHNFIKVLNGQIDQITAEIRVLEKLLVNCRGGSGEIRSPISPVKSQDDKFADLNCEDLRKKHIILSRKYNALARRQKSVFSEITPEQKSEYRDTEDSLKLVESELKRRCSPQPQNPLQKKTRSGDRSIR